MLRRGALAARAMVSPATCCCCCCCRPTRPTGGSGPGGSEE